MSIILAIETATEACSAALYNEGIVTTKYIVAPQQHANLLLPMCDELLQEANLTPAQLSAIAFGRGPGSFTGVRIAAAVAQGIAVAHDLPVIAVSSLQALAQAAHLKHQAKKVLAGIDARMKEIYWGMFLLQNGVMALENEEIVAKVENLPNLASKDWFAAGTAWQSYAEPLQQKYAALLSGKDGDLFPSAEALLRIAVQMFAENKTLPPEEAIPVYLRNNVVSR